MADQNEFARVSGDFNPMHLDALKARRTQAGAPVVHGVHLLLWALESFAAAQPELQPLKSLRAHFDNFVYPDELTAVHLAERNANRSRLIVQVGDVPRIRLTLDFGDPHQADAEWDTASLAEIPFSQSPMNPAFTELAGLSGLLTFRMEEVDSDLMFPNVVRWLGAQNVAALAATTHLVGMICPGLHSIYSNLSLRFCAAPVDMSSLAFRVTDADERFRSVEIEVAASHFVGVLETTARIPPVEQASMQSLANVVDPTEFAGDVALIVGSSRGLGELTAKIIASGGGRVIVTWHSGKEDAERVAEEIRSEGAICDLIRYDARKSAAEQLDGLTVVPTHAYFFATPSIFRSASAVFSSERLLEFLTIYVDGFWRMVKALHKQQPALSVFYPSSIAVTERPPGMTEYTMAKVAGEVLCADLNVAMAPLRITIDRLPRLLTDQTASVAAINTASVVDNMLPIIRRVQATNRNRQIPDVPNII